MGEIALIRTARRQSAPTDAGARANIDKLLADARLKLVETGTRNRLIHTPRGGKRTRSLPIFGAVTDCVFKSLVREGKSLHFLAAGDATEAQREAARLKVPRLVTAKFLRENREGLQTNLSPDLLHRRLHAIRRDAKTAEEERGANALFLAMGFLRWYEGDRSDFVREAPLILLPVDLVRDAKRSTYNLKFRDDEIATNQALQQRLRTDFAIALPSTPDSDEWLPTNYFDAVAQAIKPKRRWSIDADGIELGFYSFSRLLMVRDLEPGNWPNDALVQHPIVRGLLSDGFATEPPIFGETTALDEVFDPGDLIQVVDADSSQTKVIETVRAGRNLIVQGPPGTGKSQTITNLIASAVFDGKSVLFVAEKMAALKVVHDRLTKVGLDDLCLELHSQAASKRIVAGRLDQTLHSAALPASDTAAQQLVSVRDRLNRVAQRMHTEIGETGLTPYQALSIQIATGAQRHFAPDAELVEETSRWTRKEFEASVRLTQKFAGLTATAGPINAHTFAGVRCMGLQPADFLRLVPQLRTLATRADALARYAAVIMKDIGLRQEPTLSGIRTLIGVLRTISKLPRRWESAAASIAASGSIRRVAEVATLGTRWQQHRAPYVQIFDAAAWSGPVAALRAPLEKAAGSWLARFGTPYRRASRSLALLLSVPLPARPSGRLALVDVLLADRSLRAHFAAEAGFLADLLGEDWHDTNTDFAQLLKVTQMLQGLHDLDESLRLTRLVALLRDGSAARHLDHLETQLFEIVLALGNAIHALDLDIGRAFFQESVEALNLKSISERAAAWAEHAARYDEWVKLAKAYGDLRAVGPSAIVDGLASGRLSPSHACAELKAAYAEACWKKAIAEEPDLAAFDGASHSELIERFSALEIERLDITARMVRAKHQAQVPTGAVGAMGVIRGEIGRKRSHMPLRKLMAAAGDTIQKIKPVFMMSPISVAQHLPPDAVSFDLLIIDEASQVRPAEALGLIARCRQIVVVGDKKQLPPTNFFDRMIADEADPPDDDEDGPAAAAGVAPVTDLESILSLCEARGLESRMLRWHYRSRHPSLIEVSNAEFYRHLVLPPSPALERRDKGLILRRVAGSYDRGGQRTNRIEAEAIAAAVAEHARLCPYLSLGVVTFSTVQRDLIADLIEARRRDDPLLDAFLREGKDEDVFVKNLENAQGDERDVILISIGYGPREPGMPLDSMAFGPISAEGGERRLNVLFTRARLRCEVFVSFGSAEINLERATGRGPRVLKRFLQFAETGMLEEPRPTGGDFESPFEETVAEAIENMGFLVDRQVGSAGFRIDLAVRDPALPGRYILAIECDGATYHSAIWARERDRLRQEVLERLGWRFYRIWSTDWFYRRAAELDKLKRVLEAARHQAFEDNAAPAPSAPEAEDSARMGDQGQPAYALARCDVPLGKEIHALDPVTLAGILEGVIEQEGPIHRDEIARRVASLFGKQKAGSRVQEAVWLGLAHLSKNAPQLLQDEGFWFTQAQEDAPPVRDRSRVHASLRKPEMIAPMEIEAGIAIARFEDPDLKDRDLPAAVASLLGLGAASPKFRTLVMALVAGPSRAAAIFGANRGSAYSANALGSNSR
jgi:very-short-patch-repair endonuclease